MSEIHSDTILICWTNMLEWVGRHVFQNFVISREMAVTPEGQGHSLGSPRGCDGKCAGL